MALTPFRGGFWDTQSEFDRMFSDVIDVMRDFLGTRRTGGGGHSQQQLWAPRLEAYAKDGDLVLHADLPGVSLEDVDITLDGNVLNISGERKVTAEEGVNYYLNELPYGAFRRSVAVPEGVDADSIKARFQHGVLEVILPGATTQIEPKKIAIEGGDA
jgi:HSP20 family protein